MVKAKRAQIVILVLGAAALVFTAGRMLLKEDSEIPAPHRVWLVDVTNGDMFEVSTKEHAVFIPGNNPDTGKCSLVSAYRNESGKWIASKRDLSALEEDIEIEAVNADTGELLNQSPKVRALGN